ncbi:lactate utilization protein B [Sphingobacterium prati]|uniref:lactate utilization protein B n=1 Tax=Sphingobacterium prati TaxID=2737006 RepID=UPI00155210FC|nr:lactate utilization protein B [Sphingobacterium prati]NPE45341.1 lactate utilization protein [Sphingobacterium prati]
MKINVEKNAAAFIHMDDVHQPTHDKNLWNARMKRDRMAASIPEWEQMRDLASQIKEHALTHLDQYVEQFVTAATKRGTIVHFAKTAEDHNRIIYEILKSHNATKIVKSKSMLQEECEMAPYLESRGIELIETDLGERIQQLSGEMPSHIVMPAIHKTTDDVAELFARTIGTDPNNKDPKELTEAMRNNARPKFLEAHAGLTGANFAVAETGAFVVCTNEGNADLTAAIPPLHIASIGIEKILPKTEDLGLFIRLLSRSALGTPATQYTSHFMGPRENGTELHIVLTDNGRSERLGKAEFWYSLKCIRCGACMNTCPVYRRSSGIAYGATYSGPIGIIIDPTFDDKKYSELPFHSSLCGSCTEVCPVHINIAEQITLWRQHMVRIKASKPSLHYAFNVAGKLFGSPKWFRRAEKLGYYGLKLAPDWLVYNKTLNAWGKNRQMPAIQKETFRDWYIKNRVK